MPPSELTIGKLAQVACSWEVLAGKAGNVCPGREYADLSAHDFLASAAAIAPVMEQAPQHSVGVTILRAIEATRKVAATNTNLGIVLLLAPLAKVPLDVPLSIQAVSQVLQSLTVEDSRHVYHAIRLAKPSGLGSARAQDVRGEPTLPLRDAMELAKDYDLIAEQYATGFRLILEVAAPELIRRVQRRNNIEGALVETQLWFLAHFLDSHILRKRGADEAMEVREAARRVQRLGGMDTPAGREAFLEFDAWLRADGHVRNPGTTADLLAACLFAGLRQQAIGLNTPFDWDDHPFRRQKNEWTEK